jgi:hypothetical protein
MNGVVDTQLTPDTFREGTEKASYFLYITGKRKNTG